MELRKADPGDSRLLWQWRNDPAVRRASFNSDPIPWETHTEWFERSLETADRHIFIGLVDGHPIGMVRFDVNGDEAEVSVSVAERGRGFGEAIIRQGCKVMEELLGSGAAENLTFVANMRPENIASQKTFAKAGFSPTRFESSVGMKRDTNQEREQE